MWQQCSVISVTFVWALVSDRLVWVFQTLLISWDVHAQRCLKVYAELCKKKKKHPVISSAAGNNLFLRGARGANANNHGEQESISECSEHIKSWDRWATNTSGSTHVSQQQEAETIVGTVEYPLKTFDAACICRMRIWCQQHESIDPTCLVFS